MPRMLLLLLLLRDAARAGEEHQNNLPICRRIAS
jgi:hypothetical protein